MQLQKYLSVFFAFIALNFVLSLSSFKIGEYQNRLISNEKLYKKTRPKPIVDSKEAFNFNLEHHKKAKPLPVTWPKSIVGIYLTEENKNKAKYYDKVFPPENFTLVFFVSDKSYWLNKKIHKNHTFFYAHNQNHMWSVKRVFNPRLVGSYEYIFVIKDSVDLKNFDSLEYIKLLRSGSITIGKPTKTLEQGSTKNSTCEIKGAYTDFISKDDFFTIGQSAWKCVWNLIESETDGLGMDSFWCNCGTCGVLESPGISLPHRMTNNKGIERIQELFPTYKKSKHQIYGYFDPNGKRYKDITKCKPEKIPLTRLQLK